jgi:hypothetical protein
MLKFFIHLLFAIHGIHTAFSGQWLMNLPRTLIHAYGDHAMQPHF